MTTEQIAHRFHDGESCFAGCPAYDSKLEGHRESAADLMAIPLEQLHELPGCQCPEHQPGDAAERDAYDVAPSAVSLADHTDSPCVACDLDADPGTGALGHTYSHTCQPITLADHTAASVEKILGA